MSEPICPKCGNRMLVRTSRRVGDSQEQRLECCGHKKTRVVPAGNIRRRSFVGYNNPSTQFARQQGNI